MVRAEAFQQGVETLPVVRMLQVAEFVEQHVVPEFVRQPHDIEVQVDIPFPGAAPPIRGVVLDADIVVRE